MFRTRGFIFRKTVVHTGIVLRAYQTCMYNRLPEDEHSVSKHVEDITNYNISLEKAHFGFISSN
jgi:hypothetical protein